ncbi:hypothetical protein [uncultured Agrobacterium sp.]|uniref:hypothetical protein n=1 Tax=uncultured Agrobacterium sp. TaxID=157277 RepID=UPI002587BC6B|nr:hypothetical protein [uncultured Agrobacterium sp.]
MDEPQKALADEIVKMVEAHWNDKEEPLLLSFLGPNLKNYRDIIYPQTLKQFIGTLSDRVTVIQHSSKKAKVGIIPASKTYSYDAESTVQEGAPAKVDRKVKSGRSNKFVVLNFLEALATLDEEDLKQVVIPAAVLAKLVKAEK